MGTSKNLFLEVRRCPGGEEGTGTCQVKPHKIHLLSFSNFKNRGF